MRSLAVIVLGVALAGCSSERQLRRHLDHYISAGGNETVDDKSNQDAMVGLLPKMEPLTTPERVNLVLDVYLYYDATDNLAQGLAHEIILRSPDAVLPVIKRRLPNEPNPEMAEQLIDELEKRG